MVPQYAFVIQLRVLTQSYCLHKMQSFHLYSDSSLVGSLNEFNGWPVSIPNKLIDFPSSIPLISLPGLVSFNIECPLCASRVPILTPPPLPTHMFPTIHNHFPYPPQDTFSIYPAPRFLFPLFHPYPLLSPVRHISNSPLSINSSHASSTLSFPSASYSTFNLPSMTLSSSLFAFLSYFSI